MPSSKPGSLRGRNTPASTTLEVGQKVRTNRNLNLERSPGSSTLNITPKPSRADTASPAHSSHGAGLLTHLQHLIPRHAYFHVCIQIHQIDSIPYVHGEFAVRWRLKNASNRRKTASTNTSKTLLGIVGKGRDPESNDDMSSRQAEHIRRLSPLVPSVVVSKESDLHRPAPIPLSKRPSSSGNSSSGNSSSSTSTSSSHTPSSTQSPCEHADATPTPAKGMSPFLPLKEHSVKWAQNLHTTVKMNISRPGSTSSANATSPTAESGVLLASPMKLVVVQRVIPGDPGAPRNPRLGAVYLNLAEYAGVDGETTRRYLLRESKTNATLKLTISVTHIGGATDYIAPPLPKGEILNGLSTLLERDVYKTRPKALDLYGPYYNYTQHQREQIVSTLESISRSNSAATRHVESHGLSDTDDSSEEDEGDDHSFHGQEDSHKKTHSRSRSLDGHSSTDLSFYPSPNLSQTNLISKPSRPPPFRLQNSRLPLLARSSALSPIAASPISPPPHAIGPLSPGAIPFDVMHLPLAYGPKTTETLIEAIFNPVPIVEKPGVIDHRTKIGRIPIEDNPFVYFIPKEEIGEPVDADMTIGRSFSRGGARSPVLTEEPEVLVRPNTVARSFSQGTVDTADGSSVYSTTSPSSASVSTTYSTNSGSNSIPASSSNGKERCGSSDQHDMPRSTATSPTKGKWLRRHNTEVIAQSNPHNGTRPDLQNHVDSIVGIVL